MLTSDLVRVRMRKGAVYPPYINTENQDLLNLAETLIGVFERHVGLPRQELDEELKDLLGAGTSFLVHRGLSKLLRDRCEFEAETTVEPPVLRERVFAAAASAYRSNEQIRVDRDEILTSVAADIELPPEEIDRQLYADLKEAEVLQEFRKTSPRWLLQRYNVALAQAVLIRATGMDLVIEGESAARYREVFRKLKFFQLLHEIRAQDNGSYHIHIDGPLSLFKSSQRYGVQMASFLPTVLHCENWKLQAGVLWGVKRKEGVLHLTPKTGLQPIGHSTGQWMPEEVAWLDTQFRKLKTDWDVSTEAEIVNLGGEGILAPDFIFTHRPTGATVHMEILGFWRRGSVQSRLDLLRRHGPRNLILAISKELGVEEEDVEDLPGEVYAFRSTPVARDVHKILNDMIEEDTEPLTLF